MTIDYDKLINLDIPDVRQTYTSRDTLLYALSLGLGADPLDEDELPFVFEKDQRCLPTYGGTLTHPGFWLRDMDTGVDWVKVVHAEHRLILHQSLPSAATVIGSHRITEVVDRGVDKGAAIVWERKVRDADSGRPLCTVIQTMLARGDGGFGGPDVSLPSPPKTPDRAPDAYVDTPTPASMALLYRLNGDWNPLHADPAVAGKAGFDRPILHGLATWGVAATAVLKKVCGFDSERIASVYGRFTVPVYPGETLRTHMWVEDKKVHYTVQVLERDVPAIKNGLVELRN